VNLQGQRGNYHAGEGENNNQKSHRLKFDAKALP
jgi:hypothetical protein